MLRVFHSKAPGRRAPPRRGRRKRTASRWPAGPKTICAERGKRRHIDNDRFGVHEIMTHRDNAASEHVFADGFRTVGDHGARGVAYHLGMGQLATGLVRWVRAMNMPEGVDRDAAVSAAFNTMTAAWFAGRGTWDKSDRWAAEILEAFDRSRLDEDR